MARITKFAPPPGSRNAFEIFREFIDEMEAQSCTGLEIKIGSKRYAFSITHKDEDIRIPIGFKQFPDPRMEVESDSEE